MHYDPHSPFSKALLAGLFIGFFDTIICLVYNVAYRGATHYVPSGLINVSSLIFCINLIFLIIGITYAVFVRLFEGRDIIFDVTFLVITCFLAWRAELGHRFADAAVNHEFQGLLLGVIIIIGVGVITVPFIYRSRFLEKYVI
jgi:hypothetical protein